MEKATKTSRWMYADTFLGYPLDVILYIDTDAQANP